MLIDCSSLFRLSSFISGFCSNSETRMHQEITPFMSHKTSAEMACGSQIEKRCRVLGSLEQTQAVAKHRPQHPHLFCDVPVSKPRGQVQNGGWGGGRGSGGLGACEEGVSLHSQHLVWNPSCLGTRKNPSRRSQVRPRGTYGPDLGGEGLPRHVLFSPRGGRGPSPSPGTFRGVLAVSLCACELSCVCLNKK